MSLSRFPSATRLAIAALAALVTGAPGCGGGGDSCGPAGAPDAGLVATAGDATLTYGGLAAGQNRDCPATDAPDGLISLTIEGTGADGHIAICVPRPDLLATQAQTVELEQPNGDALARIVTLSGTANNCTFTIDATQPASGTVSSSGLCGDGVDPAGFALVVDATLALTRTCGTTVDSVAATLRGRVAVVPQ